MSSDNNMSLVNHRRVSLVTMRRNCVLSSYRCDYYVIVCYLPIGVIIT